MVFWYFLACVYGAAAEESLFRYILMDLCLRRKAGCSDNVALLLSSLAFGDAHLLNAPWPSALPQACSALALGAVLGVLYRRHGLWAPILVHAAFDFFVGFVLPALAGGALS